MHVFAPAGIASARRHRPRRVPRRAIAALAVVLVGILVPGAAADAATVSATPAATWGTNGTVYSIARIGNTVFLGGSFSQVVDPRTGATQPAGNLAALDATTGAPVSGWSGGTDDVVYTLSSAPDGSRLYVGGRFKMLSGADKRRFGAVSPATGALDAAFRGGAQWTVRAMLPTADHVYLGGDFTEVNGTSTNRLASVFAVNGLLDPQFQASADDTVRTLALSPDGTRLYVGGDFLHVNGIAHRSLVSISPATGQSDPSWVAPLDYYDSHVFALAPMADRLIVAAGGNFNYLWALELSTGKMVWRNTADGDFQAVAVVGGTIYAGGHFEKAGGNGGLPRMHAAAFDPATGFVDRSWAPSLNPNYSPYWYGCWTMLGAGNTLYAGGVFQKVGTTSQPSFAAFPPAA